MSRQSQHTPAPRSLTHEEAEELLSARLDAPIDPYDNRALLGHLQSCQSCRAFAVQMEIMARDLESLPRLPASPAVRREVHNRIQAPPPLWSRISTPNPSGGLGRALPAALAAMVLLVALTTYVLVELTNSSGGGLGSNGGSISAPGEVAVLLSPTPSASAGNGELVVLGTIAPSPTPRVIVSPTGAGGGAGQTGGLSTTTPDSGASEGNNDPALAQAVSSATTETQEAATETTPNTPVTALGQSSAPTATSEISAASVGSGDEATATEASVTQAAEPTVTPSPTPTVTAPATDTPPVPTATEAPTNTPTEEPTAIPSPTATATAAPTETAEPTLTPTEVPTDTPTLEPTATETQVPTATATPAPTDTPTASPMPTETETPTPSATPEEEVPQGQPTIQPRGGADTSEIQSQGSGGGEEGSTTIQQSGNGQETESQESGSPQIAQTGGQELEEDATEIPEPTEEALATEESLGGQTSLLLDSAPVAADLGGGVSAPNGRLEFRSGLDVFCVTLADGSLGVMNTSGTTIASLGAGIYPTWSPQGLVLLYADVSGGNSRVMTWDAQTGEVYAGGAESERSYNDTPAGWSGSRLYYQRTFPESPGEIEFHSAAWDGSDDQLIWSASDVYPVSSRPAATGDGFLIATASAWMQISTGGDAWETGSNPYGSIGVVMMSPGRTLIAYTAGSEIIVAEAGNPGAALGSSMPFTGGFDFASSGEQVVISNGNSLDIYTIYGEYVATASGSNPTGPPYWYEDTIYYLDLGGSTTLRYVSASEILAQ